MRAHAVASLVLLAACTGSSEGSRKTLEGTYSYSYDLNGEGCELTRLFTATDRARYPWTCTFCDELFDVSYDVDDDVGDCTEEDLNPSWLDGSGDVLVFGEAYWEYLPAAQLPEAFYQPFMQETGPGTSVDDERVELYAAFESDTLSYTTSVVAERGFDDGELEILEQQADTYSCGWARTDAPAYTGTYAATNDAVFPDGLMRDACGDLVRMHDFFGSYLLVEWGATECAPCEIYADTAPGMLEDLQAEGIDVNFISVYSTSSLFGEPVGRAELDAFAEKENLTFPLMLDSTGWMASVTMDSGYEGSIPVFFLLRPDGTVFHQANGIDSDRRGAELGDLIRAEAAGR